MSNFERVERYSIWDGKHTHTDHYVDNQKTGYSVDRYGFGGKYKQTDNYDKYGNKTSKSYK